MEKSYNALAISYSCFKLRLNVEICKLVDFRWGNVMKVLI